MFNEERFCDLRIACVRLGNSLRLMCAADYNMKCILDWIYATRRCAMVSMFLFGVFVQSLHCMLLCCKMKECQKLV